jgi:uncharacterized surface protein with fasciclin (FAS1) repeats
MAKSVAVLATSRNEERKPRIMTKQWKLPSRIAFAATGAAAFWVLSGSAPLLGSANALLLTKQQEVPPPPPPPPETQPPTDPNAPPAQPPAGQQMGDLIEVASKENRLATLVKAIQAAGLTETLRGKTSGPFTLFGPINSAFTRLPNDKLNSLLLPENKAELTALLKNHLVPGRLTKEALSKLKEGDELTTLGGTKLKIGPLVRRTPTISGANILTADVIADNGVIHIINAVLVPAPGAGAAPAPPVNPPTNPPGDNHPPPPPPGGNPPPPPPTP